MEMPLQIEVSEEGGVYTAQGVNVPIVTDGETFEELQDNIRDAVALYFENRDHVSAHFGELPVMIQLTFEMRVA